MVDLLFRILSIFVGFNGDKSNLRVLKLLILYKDVEGGRLLNLFFIEVEGVFIF